MLKQLSLLFILCVFSAHLQAQQPQKPTASEVHESIKKLNVLASVLYVAAHPDDENTRLISYMANHIKAQTTYLSITRGDGGQNLIGTELSELLGLIRTQELLAARRIDGGEQRFTRANDFGFSKHPDETLSIWNKNDVLSDVVWAIRTLKPDVIINRFDHRSPGTTHGHHTSSALLSIEAFDLANDASKFPEQLKQTTIWQPKRLFFNTSWWFYGSQEKFDAVDKTNLLSFDVGTYFPALGLSNNEISALSRSEHKSQGFGNTGTRGSETEYIELLKGNLPNNKTNLFDGIDITWNRVKNGNAIGTILAQVENDYDFKNPSASIPKLMEAYQLISNLDDSEHWKAIKLEDMKQVIYNCAGLYLEAVANTTTAIPNSKVSLRLEAINRSSQNIRLNSVNLSDGSTIEKNSSLSQNNDQRFDVTYTISNNETYSTPYWLNNFGSLGLYKVDEQSLVGLPETPRKSTATFNLTINGQNISYTQPIVYKTNDPVKGEVYKPFEIIPEVDVKIAEPVIIFENNQEKEVKVIVKANRDHLEGFLQLKHPTNWTVFPTEQPITISQKGQEQVLIFKVSPTNFQSEGYLTPVATIGNISYDKKLVSVAYDHIPQQTVLMPSVTKVVRLDIQKKGENIGYIVGAGDVVPESLRQIGYNFVTIQPENITAETLSRFDAIVIGIRAYNTVEALNFKQQLLFDYIAQGGNMIVQYNTSRDIIIDTIAPYDLELSRDRVTEEDASVRFLNPTHELLNYPNKITDTDFNNWVQERGLYFPNKWSKEFTPILSMNDKGETPKDGSLLVAKHGKGYYIYTGLSFFRELPEGVAGAYRLFANMLSIGKEAIKSTEKIKQ